VGAAIVPVAGRVESGLVRHHFETILPAGIAMSTPAPAPVQLRIDFVSDVVCPWCAVGLASLEQALQRLDGEVAADIHFQPFELAPDMPAEGMDVAENLKRKYGMDDAQLAANQERIRARGAELGFSFDFNARSRTWNTFDAHRLLHWAEGEGRQLALKRALLVANFSEGRDVSDHGGRAGRGARPRDPRFGRIRQGSPHHGTILHPGRDQRRAGDHHRAQAPDQRRAAARDLRARAARDRGREAGFLNRRAGPAWPAPHACGVGVVERPGNGSAR
jgi:hypothetical protein